MIEYQPYKPPSDLLSIAKLNGWKPPKKKKLLIVGHARHGKDTVAEMLKEIYGYSFESSSVAAAKIFIYDVLADVYGYKDFWECFEDRVNHRKEWHDLIVDYNTPEKSRLAKSIMKEFDIYVGMRSNTECEACISEGVFDLVVGVFDPRKPLESKDSFDIDIWEKSDFVISNAGTLDDLRRKVITLGSIFKG